MQLRVGIVTVVVRVTIKIYQLLRKIKQIKVSKKLKADAVLIFSFV
jgi:hypothetical protein